MKIPKKALKLLIKECLIEILAEGLGTEVMNEVATTKQVVPHQNIVFQPPNLSKRNPALDNIIQQASDNPIMQSILEDTAKYSLPKMMANQGAQSMNDGIPNTSGNRPTLVEHVNAEPDEIFGSDVVERWKSLAF